MSTNDKDWQTLYETGDTGWDLGKVSPPIKHYVDQLEDKTLRILIPGGGNSYEAEYLFKKGFTNVHVVEIASAPLENLKARLPDFPAPQLHHQDFFQADGPYDLILEQTFFCTLPPARRPEYVQKIHNLLKPNGKLVGLLFDFPLDDDGPPFGGDAESYRTLFTKTFSIQTMAPSYNSIEKRAGRELFINLRPAN